MSRSGETSLYDVIITGASFAGLAVANQLRGYRVLLVDRKPIGSGQTSACGTILQVLKHWGLTDAVWQTHARLVLHIGKRDFSFPSPYAWCTFDYRQLCEMLFERSEAEFLQAAVQGTDGETIQTNRGDFRARVIVDASGWRAVLASSLVPGFAGQHPMNFGIETIRPQPEGKQLSPEALHFWYESELLKRGVGWVFPRGETASLGLASYAGARQLRQPLEAFSERFDRSPGGIHGTYFPHTLRTPAAGNIFVVGDAAGMCVGLTGEGIRPALYFGERCGGIIRQVLEGESTLEAGLSTYTNFVQNREIFFRAFSKAQAALPRFSPRWIAVLARFIQMPRVRQWMFEKYWALTRQWGVPTV